MKKYNIKISYNVAFTGFSFDIAYCICCWSSSLLYWVYFRPDVDMQFCCFPKIDISHYSEDLLEWIFFKFSLVENLKKIVIFWVYCTALMLTSPKMGKARRRTHSICVPLEEQISCQPNLSQYKYAISARVHYFTQRHTLRSRGKYNWRPIAFGPTLNGKIFKFIVKMWFYPFSQYPVKKRAHFGLKML